jgi:hypothetical protein
VARATSGRRPRRPRATTTGSREVGVRADGKQRPGVLRSRQGHRAFIRHVGRRVKPFLAAEDPLDEAKEPFRRAIAAFRYQRHGPWSAQG